MMWGEQFAGPLCYSPYGQERMSKSAPCSPIKPAAPKRPPARADCFHVVHKVPVGDSPYVKAKHVQLVEKDPDRAIAMFWAAINAGDRVDSALKDMAIVMKQQNRPQEAIEAIKSLRSRCSDQAQESLDNVLLDLYKRCGRLDDQIFLLKHKLHLIHQGMAFNGKRTKTARSQGKKFQVSIEQEATRLLGNLGWAYMQQSNFVAAEAVYRKALSIEPDNNKMCNLGICLMKQGRLEEAKTMLQSITPACTDIQWASDSHLKSYDRAQELLLELQTSMQGAAKSENLMQEFSSFTLSAGCDFDLLHSCDLWQPQPALLRHPRRTARPANPEQQFAHEFVDPSMMGALLATAGFGPSRPSSKIQPSAAGANKANLGNQPGTVQQGEQFAPSQSSFQGGNSVVMWEDDDFDYSSPDENSDSNAVQVDQLEGDIPMAEMQQQTQWRVQSLRQQLEGVSVLGNACTDRQLGANPNANTSSVLQSHGQVPGRAISPPLCEQPLSSEAAPFNLMVAEEHVPLLPPAKDETAAKPAAGHGCAFGGELRLPLTFDLAKGLRIVTNRAGEVGGLDERPQVVKQLTAGGWCKPFKGSTTADMSASEMEMRRQRRLRVFQQMTLTGSTHA